MRMGLLYRKNMCNQPQKVFALLDPLIQVSCSNPLTSHPPEIKGMQVVFARNQTKLCKKHLLQSRSTVVDMIAFMCRQDIVSHMYLPLTWRQSKVIKTKS